MDLLDFSLNSDAASLIQIHAQIHIYGGPFCTFSPADRGHKYELYDQVI